MSWEALKSAVEAVITDNGNNEITGTILKDLLVNNIIPQLGSAEFKGIANPTTNPNTPESEEFYIAHDKGVYSNFGGTEITYSGIYVFKWGGSSWTFLTLANMFTEVKAYQRPEQRFLPQPLMYVSDYGTEVTTGFVDGIHGYTNPIDGSPQVVSTFRTITYQRSYSVPANYTPLKVFIKNARGANSGYRSILIHDENGVEVFKTNRSGDFTFEIYHNWTIQATCDAFYTGCVRASMSDDILSNKNMTENFKSLLSKTPLTSIGTGTTSGNTTTVESFGVGTTKYGIKQTAVIANTSYSYMYARISEDSVYVDLSSQTLVFYIKAEAACSFRFRITNGSSWGSSNNTVGTVYSQFLTFDESNNFTQIVELDLSDSIFADFYAESQRNTDSLQRLFYIITANEGSNTPIGTHVLRHYVYDSSQTVEENIGIPKVLNYASETYVNNYVSEQITENLPESSIDLIPLTNLTLRGGTPFSLTEISKTLFNLVKIVGTPSASVMGVYVEFEYDNLIDLDKTFVLDLVKNTGSDSLNQLRILKGITDWNPANYPVTLPYQDGKNLINLYELIMASSQTNIDYYSGVNSLQLLVGYFNGFDTSVSNDLVLDYDMTMYLKKDGVINVASDLTDAARSELLEDLSEEVQTDLGLVNPYITCWGDSLTAGGGWTSLLATLSGMTVYNGGTGGENARTILARQGGDVMVVNDLVIPSTVTPVLISDRDVDGGINTQLGHTVTPLLQGGAHVNPCFIGDIQGTLQWTGSGHSDLTGDWEFTRSEAGTETTIDRPTALRTDFDINRNAPHLQVLFIGQNGGYNDVAELIQQHKYLIEHSKAKNTVILGLSSGTAASRQDYENAMRQEFGRIFISLREYLSSPIYVSGGSTIISCYGLSDAGLTATQSDLDAIAVGSVPPQLLSDSVHYTSATKTVIGNMLYKKCKDLNIF